MRKPRQFPTFECVKEHAIGINCAGSHYMRLENRRYVKEMVFVILIWVTPYTGPPLSTVDTRGSRSAIVKMAKLFAWTTCHASVHGL